MRTRGDARLPGHVHASTGPFFCLNGKSLKLLNQGR